MMVCPSGCVLKILNHDRLHNNTLNVDSFPCRLWTIFQNRDGILSSCASGSSDTSCPLRHPVLLSPLVKDEIEPFSKSHLFKALQLSRVQIICRISPYPPIGWTPLPGTPTRSLIAYLHNSATPSGRSLGPHYWTNVFSCPRPPKLPQYWNRVEC